MLAASTARKRSVRVQCCGHVLVTLLGERAHGRPRVSHCTYLVYGSATRAQKWGTSQQWICRTLHCSRLRLVGDLHITSLDTLFHPEYAGIVPSSIVLVVTHLLSLFTLVQSSVFSDHCDPLQSFSTASGIKCIKNTRITFPNKIPLLRRPPQPAQ